MEVHQDDNKFFENLSRKVQLNCICNHTAKQQIVINGKEGPTTGRMFPLELIEASSSKEKVNLRDRRPTTVLGASPTSKNISCQTRNHDSWAVSRDRLEINPPYPA
jgi:hypothetical protein